MKEENIKSLIRLGILRLKQKDLKKIKSLINSAKLTAKVAKKIPLDEESATLIFREIYESIRQLGEARWFSSGYEVQSGPGSHEISLESLKEMDIKEKLKLNTLDRFIKIRNDANYEGFIISVSQAKEIIEFWN